MKISPISNYFKPNYNNIQYNRTKANLKNDIFIKNSNTISFSGGKINPKYSALSSEMTKYVMSCESISIDEIEKIIQKYSPTTTIDFLENLKATRMLTNGSAGYTKIPTQFQINDSGKIVVKSMPKTVYLYIPEKLDEESKIIFLDRLLHESTHVLQEESKDRTSGEDFFNNHLKSTKNIDATVSTLNFLPDIFTTLENISTEILVDSNLPFKSLPEKLKNSSLTFDKLCAMTRNCNTANFLSSAIFLIIKNSGIQDTALALDYIIYKAQNEYEAYSNALSSNKTLLGISGKTNFDIRLEMYTKIIEAAQKLKGAKKL